MPDPSAGAAVDQPPAESADTEPADAELLARAAEGDAAAFALLGTRHLDAVHDHLVRWTRDRSLAATAAGVALTTLLARAGTTTIGPSARPWLLRTARDHVGTELQHGDTPGDDTRVSAATLGAAGRAAPGGAAAGATAWTAVAGLDEPHFSAFDLAVRQRLTHAEVAEVLDTTPDRVATLVVQAGVRAAADGTAVAPAYAALALLRAPTAVRTTIQRAAAAHFGAVPTRLGRRRTVMAAAVVGLVLLLSGAAVALSRDGQRPPGPPAVVAEPVMPSPAPTATATLGARPDADAPTLEPTDPPTPSPSPEPSPSPSATPSPDPVVLTVAVLEPTSGVSVVADRAGSGGTATALLSVAAAVEGAGEADVTVTWRSDVAPEQVLLQGARGQLSLTAPSPCGSAAHRLRVTATHAPSGTTASASVDVFVTTACPELVVRIQQPGGPVTVPPDEAGAPTATVPVAATAEGGEVSWRWTSDEVPGTLLLADASGAIELPVSGCTPVRHLVTASAVRTADSAEATATVEVVVDPQCDP